MPVLKIDALSPVLTSHGSPTSAPPNWNDDDNEDEVVDIEKEDARTEVQPLRRAQFDFATLQNVETAQHFTNQYYVVGSVLFIKL